MKVRDMPYRLFAIRSMLEFPQLISKAHYHRYLDQKPATRVKLRNYLYENINDP